MIWIDSSAKASIDEGIDISILVEKFASTLMLKNNSTESRYELMGNGELVALVQYELKDDVIVFTHTEAMPQHQGEGYASELAKQALDDVGKQGLSVVPACSFIADFISKHPEYEKLLRSQ
jgi:predicted GNAT family acetyltransferase